MERAQIPEKSNETIHRVTETYKNHKHFLFWSNSLDIKGLSL